MPYHVDVVEVTEPNALHTVQHMQRLKQAGLFGIWQVGLRQVAGDYRLRVVAKTRYKHLHLLIGRVLRFIHDDERIRQRPATHKSQRRNLDHVALEQLVYLVLVEQIVERVVQRPQVRVDLLLQRPR